MGENGLLRNNNTIYKRVMKIILSFLKQLGWWNRVNFISKVRLFTHVPHKQNFKKSSYFEIS